MLLYDRFSRIFDHLCQSNTAHLVFHRFLDPIQFIIKRMMNITPDRTHRINIYTARHLVMFFPAHTLYYLPAKKTD